ncbi:glycosyltransferase family 2 protein [Kaistella palustris]|uniref:glycosyltransferase family 2 protein n=1 Tax=Kaistella palustris TaxID=493376 RepID=UPI00041677FF|nr:glycosyltransferase family 2 protein [Kaistella palustris]
MRTAILISTYNWPKALDLVLQTVQNQTIKPAEILIADDGSGVETKILIDRWELKSGIPIKHFWQEDQGFRKTVIMNKAVAGTSADYIIQIDGDILLHKDFIKDHISEREEKYFLNGSRSLISKEHTEEIMAHGKLNFFRIAVLAKNKINATRNTVLSRFFRKNHFKSSNVKGCNFSFWREDFIAVNGYNNEMNGWGHEDIELAARLNNLGIKQRRLKMKAVCFHLYHDFFDRKSENRNFQIYQNVVNGQIIRCGNGFLESK